MNLAPVVLFVYNRPWHTRKTIEALKKNQLASESELIIYSDAAKNENHSSLVQEVRCFIHTVKEFKTIEINEHNYNYGLANSVISGVTEVINKYGKVIVLEDDIVTHPYFLKFMNSALEFYQNYPKIFSITGINYLKSIPRSYNHHVYLSYRGSSYGWATWKDRWAKADWEVKDYEYFILNKNEQKLFNRAGNDVTKMLILQMNGKIDSWGIRWLYTQFKNNAFTLFPVFNLVRNIGLDGSGTHSGKSKLFDQSIVEELNEILLPKEIELCDQITKIHKAYFRRSIIKNIVSFVRKLLFQE